MIANIAPITITHTATKIEILMNEFKLGATTGSCTVYLMDEFRVVDAKRVDIPEEVYATWGTDDSFIVDYVLQVLNLIAG